MNKFILGIVVIAVWQSVVLGVSVPRPNSACPVVGCPYIQYPASCRAKSYLIHNGRVCPQCDKCIEKGTPTDGKGCPTFPCPAIAYPPECTGRKYFVWKGRMCQDCDVDTCE